MRAGFAHPATCGSGPGVARCCEHCSTRSYASEPDAGPDQCGPRANGGTPSDDPQGVDMKRTLGLSRIALGGIAALALLSARRTAAFCVEDLGIASPFPHQCPDGGGGTKNTHREAPP